jgi:UDP-N-acetylglucosamine diphosphorylase / glucose-1-phosphate thymidylyltransferase / UDP-N-acetylgalactosamine diphosphorylase / glucosamine-1-phosphate N-acetyltransferase / galactosamine-1-phosphate N-acetyltransferase
LVEHHLAKVDVESSSLFARSISEGRRNQPRRPSSFPGPDFRKPLVSSGFFLIPVGVHASEFFALPPSLARFSAHFPADVPPWEWLKRIAAALAAVDFGPPRSDLPAGVKVEGKVWIDPSVRLPHYATLLGPAWIGAGTEIRPGAFVRGNVIVGEGCVLGNSCEYKNCLLLDGVQTPHYNYVGDSILGNRAHLGAGVICSNLRLDQGEVTVRLPSGVVGTGLRKFGAVLGDGAEVGCNAVLNPGSLLGPRALVTPCTNFGGYLPAATIARSRQSVTTLPRRD